MKTSQGQSRARRPRSKTVPYKTEQRRLRLAKGLSTEQLAVLVPCGLATVYRCERDGHWPRNASLRAAYRRALGLVEQAT